ncbi:related to Ubiquitin-like modifier-activating enzyme ATG7 [Saccharomycodes ludwigii]|uniref:Related to Ubiquitin-like modifier-activating enzyme ATG7 n=1 Tax=Saccharomycodes ludwigii TaxID=36035 RepID=A0A376B1E5_9ASCO|nr:hypothetical protein SCDLUD_004760 [Saccharomycodes ludwigii]KAH3899321.1 hypothetical protein SCDLUD_004760 [Saccharomycodes ludwigii]SSD58516.1 related to Ubiquitin-like modifier-activating enzyme ATG7 [Saccharomycodes ludwigii]
MTTIKFTPGFKCFMETSFYSRLREIKLNNLKLSDEYISLNGDIADTSSILTLNSNNFEECNHGLSDHLKMNGVLKNFNTEQEFITLNKLEFLKHYCIDNIWNTNDIQLIINSFVLITFADLKKYTLLYWVAFPVFQIEGLTFEITSKEVFKGCEDDDECIKFIIENPSVWCFLQDEETKGCENFLMNEVCNTLSTKIVCVRNTLSEITYPPSYLKSVLSLLHKNSPHIKSLKLKIISGNGNIIKYDVNLMLHTIDNDGKKSPPAVKVTGWERNNRGKLGPKFIDLSTLLDPLKMNEQSVDLNLKLMKWRIEPDLNLDIIKSKKVLLLGAGTLGCYVARTLLSWGVRNFTFVDNGRVSHSNPVRQSLFNFEDVGQWKAEAAAKNLKKIFPQLNTESYVLDIPMIGHPPTNEGKQKKDYEKLYQLFQQNDAIFLLVDSRETRWLPTVMGKSFTDKGHEKIIINAAIGFNSYLVMRHGNFEDKLGCYFCNDVVAPNDSLSDRTLDQMCTVTRPGCALMASSLAVELFVSYLQKNVLGEPQHQIRGFLNDFSMIKLHTPSYECCSACSLEIVEEYKRRGWDFVLSALKNYKVVEELSGLADVQREMEKKLESINFGDSDDDEFVTID